MTESSVLMRQGYYARLISKIAGATTGMHSKSRPYISWWEGPVGTGIRIIADPDTKSPHRKRFVCGTGTR